MEPSHRSDRLTDRDEYDIRRADDTEKLTKALERGEISPLRYTRLRARIVGTPNLVDGIVRPFADLFRAAPSPDKETAK